MRNRTERTYDPCELKLFSEYRDRRAKARPKKCTRAKGCWVEVGPPAMTAHTTCEVCHGTPVAIKDPGATRPSTTSASANATAGASTTTTADDATHTPPPPRPAARRQPR